MCQLKTISKRFSAAVSERCYRRIKNRPADPSPTGRRRERSPAEFVTFGSHFEEAEDRCSQMGVFLSNHSLGYLIFLVIKVYNMGGL